MLFRFKRNQPFDYVHSFAQLAGYSVKAAEYLNQCFKYLPPKKLPQMLEQMHKLEHDADVAKDFMVIKLAREFLPPFDKDDIMFLAHQIDTVTDTIEEVLIIIDVHQIEKIPPEARQFSAIIVKCCQAMNMALKEMKDYKNSQQLYAHLAVVNRMKKEGKELHGISIKKVYGQLQNQVEVFDYIRLFDRLERCTYNCKEVTNTVARMVLRYS